MATAKHISEQLRKRQVAGLLILLAIILAASIFHAGIAQRLPSRLVAHLVAPPHWIAWDLDEPLKRVFDSPRQSDERHRRSLLAPI